MDKNGERVLLEWRTHLALRQPRKALLTAAAILLGSLIVLISSRNPLLAGVCVLVLLAALAEFLFPLHYRLTEGGAQMRNFLSVRYLPWERVRRCYRGARGIKLSPLARPDWREAFRGLTLWVEGEQQEQAVAVIRALRPLRELANEGVDVESAREEPPR